MKSEIQPLDQPVSRPVSTAAVRPAMLREMLRYLLVVLVVGAVSVVGGLLTDSGMGWYDTLNLPEFTPPGGVIGMVWTAIYIMCTIAAMLVIRYRENLPGFRLLIALFIVNAVLNAFWSWCFFVYHGLGLAIAEMILLNLTTLAIIVLTWRSLRAVSLLLLPYFGWVCFATYLTVAIMNLNS